MNKSISKLRIEIRKKAAEIIFAAKSSHIGGVFSCADILAVLYGSILKIDSSGIQDTFILSKGHCCAGVYSALYCIGLLNDEHMVSFAKDDSILTSHISHKVPHVDFSTGSLGHGLPFAAGKAYSRKQSNVNNKVYCLMSDGELNEGSNWEAFMFAAHHNLDNLTAIIDYNKLQSLTSTGKTLELEPLEAKLISFNWKCIKCNGHSIPELLNAFEKDSDNKPKVIICDTIKGFPISFMLDKVEWHYKPPNAIEYDMLLRELSEFRA